MLLQIPQLSILHDGGTRKSHGFFLKKDGLVHTDLVSFLRTTYLCILSHYTGTLQSKTQVCTSSQQVLYYHMRYCSTSVRSLVACLPCMVRFKLQTSVITSRHVQGIYHRKLHHQLLSQWKQITVLQTSKTSFSIGYYRAKPTTRNAPPLYNQKKNLIS
jgi:hypothetical protein